MSSTETLSITPCADTSETYENLAFISERTLDFLLIPSDISIKCYDFKISEYQRSLFYELGVPLPESIDKAVVKRQAEFLAGRYSASSALKVLGINSRNIAIGKHRSPVWPDKIIASITHTTTTSLCAASYKDNYQYLGIDIEYEISTELMNEIKRSIITRNEEEMLTEHTMQENSLNFSKVFTLVFSAKESLFKALYPSVGYYFDFSAASITQINTANNSFTLVLAEDLSTKLTKGAEFTGFFHQIEQQILTVIAQK
ncbi:MAG: enterobactin synthetase component D [Colwellia sp.]|jgi:4'-phosphopantetheinyl transferase EntD